MRNSIATSFLLMTVLAVNSCKLDPVIYPNKRGLNIKYQVILLGDCNCKITYADSLNYDATASFNAKNWEKVFKVENRDYFKTAYIKVSSNDTAVKTNGTASIYLNGELKASTRFTVEANPIAPTVSYKIKK
jgi:hypothetical protein